ncbi:MAG TPA: GerMN domain-containing protein [Gaiellaceae bacterium]|nr:GerMN domain-containing protein [Gaiellaceae bacterium]
MGRILRLCAVSLLVVACGGVAPTTSIGAQTATITIYAPRGNPGVSCTRVFPLQRRIKGAAVLAGAMRALLAGPTTAERRRGYGGWFSAKTAGYLRSVRLRSGVAYVDFRNFSGVIPNASSSCGSALLLAQLNRTALQFRAVRRAIYSFNGSTKAFYEWLQRAAPARAAAASRPRPSLAIEKAAFDRAARTVDLRLRICFSSGPRAAISVSERRTRRGDVQAVNRWTVPRAKEPTDISAFSCRPAWRVNWLLKPRLAGPRTYTVALRVRDAYGTWTPQVAFSVTSP